MMLTLIKRLGLPGLLGLSLLGAASWALWSWVPRQQQASDTAASQSRRLRHEVQAGESAASSSRPTLTPELAWRAFWQVLPDASQRAVLQDRVLAGAHPLGLDLSSVQFTGGPESGVPGLWRQRMVMPVEGRYADVRAWLSRLLSEPALSVDGLDIQRSDVMGETVKARVSVSLWWRLPGGPH